MSAPVIWLEPWYPVDESGAERAVDMAAALEKQLRREICERHVLHGESVRLIARRADTDDVLFALTGRRVAEVHLTWRRGRARSLLARHEDIRLIRRVAAREHGGRCVNG